MEDKPLFILFKFASRSRPERFFKTLDSIYSNMVRDDFHVSCTLDLDDFTMNNEWVKEKIEKYNNISVEWGASKSKIDAINRSMPNIEWDIVVNISDDMLISFYGFDEIIRTFVKDSVKDLDGLIHIPDGDAKDALNVLYIATKKYYDRFGYIYHPEYLSLFCDNESMDVAKMLNKYYYYDCPCLFEHKNPAYGHLPKDALFIEQQKVGWGVDMETYNRRRAKNFDL